jgi:hypothetical protein
MLAASLFWGPALQHRGDSRLFHDLFTLASMLSSTFSKFSNRVPASVNAVFKGLVRSSAQGRIREAKLMPQRKLRVAKLQFYGFFTLRLLRFSRLVLAFGANFTLV